MDAQTAPQKRHIRKMPDSGGFRKLSKAVGEPDKQWLEGELGPRLRTDRHQTFFDDPTRDAFAEPDIAKLVEHPDGDIPIAVVFERDIGQPGAINQGHRCCACHEFRAAAAAGTHEVTKVREPASFHAVMPTY